MFVLVKEGLDSQAVTGNYVSFDRQGAWSSEGALRLAAINRHWSQAHLKQRSWCGKPWTDEFKNSKPARKEDRVSKNKPVVEKSESAGKDAIKSMREKLGLGESSKAKKHTRKNTVKNQWSTYNVAHQ